MNDTDKISMTMDEQKKVMLDILICFADFCEANRLQYFLDAGTLLGAVRHAGYIPWDDDIDVGMPRKDYDRFCEIVKQNEGYISENHLVEFPETTIYPFLKISDVRTCLIEFPETNPMEVGVYIDVFPKDGIVDLDWKSKVLCKVSRNINLIHWFNTFSIYSWKNSDSFLKRFISAIGRKCIKNPNRPIKWQRKLIENHNKRHPLEECRYMTTLVNGEFFRCAPKHCFQQQIMLEFEGRQFRAPIDYDTYLRVLYHDTYMQLPEESLRVKHHNTKAFWITNEAKEKFFSDN